MKLEAQGGSAEVSESEVSPSSNGIGTSAIQEPYTPAIERSRSACLATVMPRAHELGGESRRQVGMPPSTVYSPKWQSSTVNPKPNMRNCWQGCGKTWLPEGALEHLLVEKLATTAWRYRRLLLAESAEIRKSTEFVESDQRDQEREAAEMLWSMSGLLYGRGLIRNTDNRHALEQCLEWLAHLRKGIEEVGFRPDQDAVFLKSLYGNRDPSRLGTDLYDSYETLLQIAETPEEERERKRYPSPSECRQIVMDKIDKEIRRIKRDQKARSSVQAARTQLEIVSRNVPDGPGLDRLLRYETSLDRSFDRTLSQLERLQRVWLGQPVLPKLEVHHSVS